MVNLPPQGAGPAERDDACGGLEPAAPVYDAEVVAELEAVFGRPRLMNLLAGLGDEIAQRLRVSEAQRDALSRDAHALVSASGTLGFGPLSQACAALEHACHAGSDLGPALARARRSADAASDAIERLRAEAA
jgi:HPt (histidine-containing phosphotransfer) domain-containing protein